MDGDLDLKVILSFSLSLSFCVCVCVCTRERERELRGKMICLQVLEGMPMLEKHRKMTVSERDRKKGHQRLEIR